MYLYVSDPGLVDDLGAHFRRSGFAVEPMGGSMVDVRRPDAPEPEQERREIEVHLSVWRATHPEASVLISE
jgi:hypothetical protein